MTKKQKQTIKKLKKEIEKYKRFFKNRKKSKLPIFMTWESFNELIKIRKKNTNELQNEQEKGK